MSNCNDTTIPCTDIPCNGCNDCPTCGCCHEECTCTTPGYDGTGCIDIIHSDCVTYTGNNLPCIPIQKTNTLTVILKAIADYFKDLFNHITSSSLVVTPSGGSCNKDLTVELVPSTDANNILTLGTDGHPYVPAPAASINDVNIISGDCIVWTKTVINGVPTFTYVIDWNCVASHVCAEDCEILCPNPINLTIN